ncbi:MAG TPA: SHOCT domain-containing protein [Dehalococcoidia bacterium]|nr:SHOCT domain-containing protein [Dehalococcoidia bacterium]
MSDFLIGLITVLIYIAFMVTWGFTLFDLFARGDIRGMSKALWLFAIVFLPVIGILTYFITRPRTSPENLWFQSEAPIYAQRNETITQEVQTLAKLHDQGAISDDEFTKLKQRAIA